MSTYVSYVIYSYMLMTDGMFRKIKPMMSQGKQHPTTPATYILQAPIVWIPPP